MSKFFKVVSLIVGLFVLSACAQSNEKSEVADGEWPKEITVVQMPNENDPSVTQAMHEQLSKHLENELGIKVKEHQGTSYAVGIEALASGNLDVMLASPMSYFQANKITNAELLVTPQYPEGAFDYYTAFITQSDNDEINSLADLKGKNIAFVNPASSSGYLYPKATLVEELNLEPDLIEQSGYFFKDVAFSESHPNSIIGVKMGDYDAAVAAKAIIDSLIDAGQIEEKDIKIIGRSIDIPDASYMMRGDLPEDFKKALRDAFVSFEDEDYFEALHRDKRVRFKATEPSYYDESIELLKTINALDEKGE